MSARDKLGTFEAWYDRLVKNKMGGAALPICGFFVGLSLVRLTTVLPSPYDDHIGYVGLRVIDISALVFCLTMVGLAISWFCAHWKSVNRPVGASKPKPGIAARRPPTSG
jgi:hypothetical protein